MPPKKKVVAPEPAPSQKLTGMFGWCLLPQHELCPKETSSVICSCACHKEDEKPNESN